jgi:molybdopterin converting factor small subunit
MKNIKTKIRNKSRLIEDNKKLVPFQMMVDPSTNAKRVQNPTTNSGSINFGNHNYDYNDDQVVKKDIIMVSVLYFAQARMAADGIRVEKITLPNQKMNSDEILTIIEKIHPKIHSLKRLMQISINCKTIRLEETITLNEGDEIALLPPIAGG